MWGCEKTKCDAAHRRRELLIQVDIADLSLVRVTMAGLPSSIFAEIKVPETKKILYDIRDQGICKPLFKVCIFCVSGHEFEA